MQAQVETGRRRAALRRLAAGAVRWLAANAFAPGWLHGRWRRPFVGYVSAAILQLIVAVVVTAAVAAFPTFRFREAPLILVIVLVGLGLGAGPGIVATLIGGLVLDVVAVPPYGGLRVAHGEDVAGIVLFLAIGLTISLVAGQNERRRRDAEALAASLDARARQIDALFDAVPDGLGIFDATGKVVRFNRGAAALFGVERHEDLASIPAAYQVRTPAGEPLAAEEMPLARALRGEQSAAADMLVRTADGDDQHIVVRAAPWTNPAEKIEGVVVVAHDVTALRLAERRTRESLDALLAMAQAMVDAPRATSQDATTGAMQPPAVGQRLVDLARNVLGCQRIGITAFDWERGVQRPVAVAGLTAEQERAWWESVDGAPLDNPPPETDPDLAKRFFAGEPLVLDMAQPPFRDMPNPFGVTTVLVTPLLVEGRVIGSLSLDHGGAPHQFTPDEIALAGAVAQLSALTLERERLRGEREEARANELALRETNQRLDEFLSVATHELRSPLTGIRGSVQLARRRLQRDQPPAEVPAEDVSALMASLDTLLDRAEAQIDRQARLIDDLLDVSRAETGHLDLHLEPCDLGAVVADCVAEQRLAWPARAVDLTPSNDAAIVRADADRIRQVVANFVSNALKYSPADRPVEVSLRHDAREVRVEVRDRGQGLTPQQQALVWDRYRRVQGITVLDDAPARGGGLGLGLYVSRAIVEQHGGRCGVESAPGEGSTFWFALPESRS